MKAIVALGAWVFNWLESVGRAGIFIMQSIFRMPTRWGESINLLVKQLYSVGVLSLVIVIVSGTFIGMVLSLQGYSILAKFGSEEAVGQLLALSLLRELSPVVTALLFAGRAGSSLTAEIGLMKTTEQLSSYEMMGVDPLRRVIAPRFIAGVICLPLLSLIFSAAGILGGQLVSVGWLGVHDGAFWSSMQQSVYFDTDVLNGLIKAMCFAVAVTWIAVYQGYECAPTSEGIGKATTRTVVLGSLAVLALDFVLTAAMFGDF
ncbi:lipid asymmetry maintenance ABC transporter permease subunit MlaE [Marinomonas hwangdonensis]|uniref:Intermembrane phospholipid transport system permease protein MlaE n=1 Tax=Marinomonas hwangdonensis TaxID=1053647 RepID=A0A3M8Q0N6_9GAMM|nr:lipid asymmetry maintenance ABC transporter permease subunit MlaE [Marinomonas hwangdonensis]RNF49695.1 lipid asymmetry maintenance ABC transporter permease subunit MlaE [Marinomonas hwangdonensis]